MAFGLPPAVVAGRTLEELPLGTKCLAIVATLLCVVSMKVKRTVSELELLTFWQWEPKFSILYFLVLPCE